MKLLPRYIIRSFSILLVLGLVFSLPYPAWGEENEYRPLPPSLKNKPEPVPDFSGKSTLSLAEALDIAYKCNPALRKAELELDRAEIIRDQAASAVLFTETGDMIVTPDGRMIVSSYEQADVNYKTKKKAAESEQLKLEKDVVTAYAAAVKSNNQAQLARLMLQDFEAQNQVNMVATIQGVISNLDLRASKRGLEEIQERLRISEYSYEMSLANLRSVLNQNEAWDPILNSKPVLGSYERHELWLELSRASEQSILQLQARTLLELEEIKKFWTVGGGLDDQYLDQINLRLRGLDYEQARRDTRGTVEQLYQSIDILEQQITIAERTLEQKEEDAQIARLKFETGMIPYRSLRMGEPSLNGAELALQKASLELENLRTDLAERKANFGYLTGQQVYSRHDWVEIGAK